MFKVPHDVTQAVVSRDAIAKELYARTFDTIFDWVNKAINVSSRKQRWIGILDIFGFEDMRVNSFEQVCMCVYVCIHMCVCINVRVYVTCMYMCL